MMMVHFVTSMSKTRNCCSDILRSYDGITIRYSDYIVQFPGGRLNKKDGLTRYGDSHVKDKTS